MATTVEKVVIRIEAQADQIKAELQRVTQLLEQNAQKNKESLDKMGKGFETAGRAATVAANLVKGFLAAFTIQKIIDATKASLDWATEIKNTATQLGVTTTSVQELDYAAATLGIGQEKLRKGMENLVQTFTQAKNGADDLRIFWQQLLPGENLQQIKTADDLLAKVASRFRDFDSQTQFTLAEKLFGGRNDEMVLLLNQGAEGLRKLREEAHKAGVVMSSELVDANAKVNAELKSLEQQAGAKLRQALAQLAPLLKDLAQLALELATWIAKLADGFVSLQKISMGGLYAQLKDVNREIKDMGAEPKTTWEWISRIGENATPGNSAEQKMRRAQQRKKELEDELSIRNQLLIDVEKPYAGPDKPKSTFNFNTAGIKQAEDMLKALRAELAAMDAELSGGKVAAEWEKLRMTLVGIGASQSTIDTFKKLFDQKSYKQGQLALKEFNEENEKNEKILQAIISGQRELIPLIEAEYALRKKLGSEVYEKMKPQLDAVLKAQERIRKEMEQAQATWAILENQFESGANKGIDALTRLTFEGGNAFKTLRDVALDVVKDIYKALLELAIKNPLKNMLLNQNNPTLGSVGDMFFGGTSGGASGFTTGTDGVGLFGGLLGFAGGGDVAGGRPILVGERGPEIFNPGMSGHITPNHALGGGGNSVPPIVNINVINNSGEKSSQRERGSGNDMRREFEVMIGENASKDILQRGPLAMSLEGTYPSLRRGVR